MKKQTSPFAALTGIEKQIKWLEYQSIRLPYVPTTPETIETTVSSKQESNAVEKGTKEERPQPPPEVPRVLVESPKTRRSQYDAVIARMKQAEIQARRYEAMSKFPQQPH